MPGAPHLQPAPEARSDKSAPAGPASGPRKPAGKELLHADGKGRQIFSKRGRPKLDAEPGEVVENTTLICNILRTPEKRAKVITQLQRLRHDRRRRYDPRNAARLISQRLHYPQIAVELVIQGQPGEMEIWLREYRAVRTRAEAAIEQYWMGRAA